MPRKKNSVKQPLSAKGASKLAPHRFGGHVPKQRPGEALGLYAYRVMRDAVRSGTFRTGEHLREADISEWLGISRTPVREAFHRIISEGLLVNGPWNGAMVAEFDAQQLVELYAVRETLEGTAAALAARHASEAEAALLFEIVEREVSERSDSRLVQLNADLHQAIYNAAHNRFLLQSLTSVVDALGLLRHSTFVLPGSIEQAHYEHLEVVNAINEGKAKRAEQAARKHIRSALELRLQLLKKES